MNDVLDTIERELMVAVRRSNARRRRRRSLGIFTGAAVAIGLTAAGGIAAVTGTPIDRLLGGETRLAKPAGTQQVDLRVSDPGGLGWRVTTYAPKVGGIATTTAADGLATPMPRLTGRAGFAIAYGMLIEGPVTGVELDVVRTGRRLHYLVAGTVDQQVEQVVVEVGGGSFTANLTRETVTAPVDRDQPGLTPEGRALAARMPDEVVLRTYAVGFPPDWLAGRRWVRATIVATLPDGSTRRLKSTRWCVSRACGQPIPPVAGQGRAG